MSNSNSQPSPRLPVSIVAMGSVPSKKNSRTFAHGKSIPSKAFYEWQNRVKLLAMEETQCRRPEFGTDEPCRIVLTFFLSDFKRHDIDNMVSSWLDALQTAGIISDDCWTSIGHPAVILRYAKEPYSMAQVFPGNPEVDSVVQAINDSRRRK